MADTARVTVLMLSLTWAALVPGCGSSESPPPPYTPSIYAIEKLDEAMARSDEGNFREALRLANEAMADDPQYAAARYWKSAFLVRLGRFEDARVTLHQLIALAPRHPEARMLYGLLMEKADLILEARASYEIAAAVYAERLAGGQNSPANHLEHAIATYLHRGRLVGLQTIAKVIEEFPEYQPAQFVRSRISADDRDFFLRQATQSKGRMALSGNLPMPLSEASDTALTGDLLESLSLPENWQRGD